MEEGVFPIINVKQGTVLITEGKEVPECFSVIRSGLVRVSTKSGVPLIYENGVMGTGCFFSLAACLNKHVSLDTVVAETDAGIMCITRENFSAFIAEHLADMNRILAHLSMRLRGLNEYLIHGTIQDTGVVFAELLLKSANFFESKEMFTTAFCAYTKYLMFMPHGDFEKTAKEKIEKYEKYGKNIRFDYRSKDMKRFYPEGTLIFCEKEPGNEMFVVEHGTINITKIIDDKEVILAVLKQGDILGELGLIDQKPRSANAIAATDCEIMAITNAIYLPLLKDGNLIIERICNTLAARICIMHEKIVDRTG
ncbi:MAG: hypothetical protein Ta2G_14010 [Termitinemataceae bacterium]|nr:MAG: hypothetical protein Ta2G_14010 [Termitinemataceae bacterium]